MSTGSMTHAWVTGPCMELSKGRVVLAQPHTEDQFSKGEKRKKRKGSDIRIKPDWQAKAADDYYNVLLLELGGKVILFLFCFLSLE